jgi:hypothetical protein
MNTFEANSGFMLVTQLWVEQLLIPLGVVWWVRLSVKLPLSEDKSGENGFPPRRIFDCYTGSWEDEEAPRRLVLTNVQAPSLALES